MICPFCSHPTDSDSHIYDTTCALSNAEYDQLEAEVRTISTWTADPELHEKAKEIVRDELALAKINREQRPIYTNDWPPAL